MEIATSIVIRLHVACNKTFMLPTKNGNDKRNFNKNKKEKQNKKKIMERMK